jgi:glycosyltransferase involved in cell wall biosynthesis
MRVTHIFKATGLSGAEAHILTLSQALKAEGFECRLLVLTDPAHPPEALFAAARAREIPYDSVPCASDLDLSVLPKLIDHLESSNTQIVHTHMIHGDLYGTLAARWAKRTIVQSRHNHDQFRKRLPVKLLMQVSSAPAKTIIAISKSLADFTRDVEGIPGEKIVCIHYGLDPETITSTVQPGALRAELGLSPDQPLIAAVGRLTTQKGWRYLIEAFSQVRAIVPNAQLIFAGDGPARAELEAQAASLGNAVRFLGWRTDAYNLMADGNVLAVPSLWEGFGLVTLEAMALSKPIVASRVSALPEIIVEGETGLLVPPADSDALANALTSLLTEPNRAKEMGKRGRLRLEKEFTVQTMARKHVQVYREAASRVPEFRA